MNAKKKNIIVGIMVAILLVMTGVCIAITAKTIATDYSANNPSSISETQLNNYSSK